LKKRGGGGLLRKYQGSYFQLIGDLFPECKWIPWKFKNVPHGFWSCPENRQLYFNWLQNELQLKNEEEWYTLDFVTIKRHSGAALLRLYYNSSPSRFVSSFLHKLRLWKFKRTPKGYWKEGNNTIHFLHYLSRIYNLATPSDWYRLQKATLSKEGGAGVRNYISLESVLPIAFPSHSWDMKYYYNLMKKRSQFTWKTAIESYFNHTMEVIEEFLHSDIKFDAGDFLELDMFVKEASLAFEYQGIQHYQAVNIHLSSPIRLDYRNLRDNIKEMKCGHVGITLVQIPFWIFDLKELENILTFKRPDLLTRG